MKSYVAGFLFARDNGVPVVALVKKRKPDWQAGLWNGIGGKIEEGESAKEAMQREFEEETKIRSFAWEHVVTLTDKRGWVVFFFKEMDSILGIIENKVPTLPLVNDSGEELAWHPINNIPENIIHNLKWLIPFCAYQAITEPISVVEPKGE